VGVRFSGTATDFPSGRTAGVVQSGSAPFTGSGPDERLCRNPGIAKTKWWSPTRDSRDIYVHVEKKEDVGDRGTLLPGADGGGWWGDDHIVSGSGGNVQGKEH